MPRSENSAFFLVGPTAVGKTAVAHELAARLGMSILSADSMMVYRHMNIGTAKPTPGEIEKFHYAGLDLADPDRDFSVADYLRAVKSRDETKCIACGGTGLYVRCLTEGLREIPAANEAIRARAEKILTDGGIAALQDELKKIAPDKFAALADPKNPRRLIRALEAASSDFHPVEKNSMENSTGWKSPMESVVIAGLRMEKAALEKRIRARVAKMYADGLIEEARALREKFALSKTALQAIGYAEAFAVIDGKLSRAAAMERTAIRTRQLAKKQMTWFRNQHRVAWVDVAENDSPAKVADEVHSLWKKYGPATLHC